MRRLPPLFRLAGALALLGATSPLSAGSAPTVTALDLFGEDTVRNFSAALAERLYEREVMVAFVARCGRAREDLPAGITFTHAGIAVFEAIRHEDGSTSHGYTVYQIYQGAEGRKDRSFIAQDFLYDLSVGMVEPEIGVLVPSLPLQRRLLVALRNGTPQAIHNPAYNLLDNPHDDRFDNCITWLAKLTFAAIYETTDPARIHRNLVDYFPARPLKLPWYTGLGAGFIEGMTLEDRARDGSSGVATFDTLRLFLEQEALLAEAFVVRCDPATGAAHPMPWAG
jgi:hypothetical protein